MHIIRLSLFMSSLLASFQCAAMAPGPGQGRPAMQRASGNFDLVLTPAQSSERDGNRTARMAIAKRYHGQLAGSGEGEMLSAVTGTPGSAAYVAIERVGGTLLGKRGSFVLQHSGTRSGGQDRLDIAIVPDSGTGELAGIRGTLAIRITDGQHAYSLEFTLENAPR